MFIRHFEKHVNTQFKEEMLLLPLPWIFFKLNSSSCFRREIRPTPWEEACLIKTQLLPTQEEGETLGLTNCSALPGWMCPANNLLQCTVSGSAPKVDTCNCRGFLRTALDSGPAPVTVPPKVISDISHSSLTHKRDHVMRTALHEKQLQAEEWHRHYSALHNFSRRGWGCIMA